MPKGSQPGARRENRAQPKPKPPSRNLVTLLPYELWVQIFEYLPSAYAKDLMHLHRTFFLIARSCIWRTLTISYVGDEGGRAVAKTLKRAGACLKNPALAAQVRHICVREKSPWVYSDGTRMIPPRTRPYEKITTWVAQHTIRPLLRLQHLVPTTSTSQSDLQERGNSTPDTLRVVPHLIVLHDLTIDLRFAEIPGSGLEALPPTRMAFYQELFSLLGRGPSATTHHTTNEEVVECQIPENDRGFRFRSLNAQVHVGQLDMLGSLWFPSGSQIFSNLRTFSLHLGTRIPMSFNGIYYQNAQVNDTPEHDVHSVVSPFRTSLQRFNLTLDLDFGADLNVPILLESLGHFPSLAQLRLDLGDLRPTWAVAYAHFVVQHHSTLQQLSFVNILEDDLMDIWTSHPNLSQPPLLSSTGGTPPSAMNFDHPCSSPRSRDAREPSVLFTHLLPLPRVHGPQPHHARLGF
ncbi:hypothetical protein BDN72DRAFT_892023 [Pluteus cervinus]|uniref:Uncharacterized protein n=1 Tax=Pluteus cervinus TaxID=181527 RepID=A0ACD3BBP1_9AGAR|nr:hypothetical protein BDN72DRAFT_892023 [Pluteus cervinus]